MNANTILFANPIPKVYQTLPPPRSELDEVLAFIYRGPVQPTDEEFKRTPLLISHNQVAEALEWLRLNHIAYHDIDISYDNLKSYPQNQPPVVMSYHPQFKPKEGIAKSLHGSLDEEEGTASGPCPLVVHGVTGEQLHTKSIKSLKALTVKHLTSGGQVMALGHAENTESIYNNPQLFQLDEYFPIIAFNHEQIKASTTGGFLLAERHSFDDITDRLLSVDKTTLTDLARRLSNGDRVIPNTPEEKACFQLLGDLDHIAGHVEGSITNTKYMRNEIWSLIAYKGAPSWFITFTPADVQHPICIYYAGTDEIFKPVLIPDDIRAKLVADNPVAGAHFLDMMVRLFIKHVLGVNSDHDGLYGKTSAYYGTMIEYLEGAHKGEFIDQTMEEVKSEVAYDSSHPKYKDPTQTLPDIPPYPCDHSFNHNCQTCHSSQSWWRKSVKTVNDLLLKSNVHRTCDERCFAQLPPAMNRPPLYRSIGKYEIQSLQFTRHKISSQQDSREK
ncbi:hypothetical protein GLOTRDRAFT_108694 [Gloeophyllum trabeum ATCC 11539]|uniref:Uncharacterized protein n=1 Tax=Gloeophyllum trabeum (strain ATCC 11539 / FP-39264 / Madison 617) TaxID=670483 RepID=S7PS67_GLOTA|nr:uncharacterized protein GLOTRDRAFT_108694 [Gloeophyllum trabeum ATCC 11539]EPQ50222.1 hypothetical protein GLOTRDRAFT_108694 [Gloeophyllum trabeum ATCC 11539]